MMHSFVRRWSLAVAVMIAIGAPHAAQGLDVVEFHEEGEPKAVAGQVLAQADDGGLLVLSRDGRLWPIEGERLLGRRENSEPFESFTSDQLSGQLLGELGPGFQVYPTKHYLICHSTSLEYARWCEHLFERLYRAFTVYWKRRGFPIDTPQFPLVAIVFEDRRAYQDYGRREVGDAIENIVGFYSLETNRVALYDPRPRRARPEGGRRRRTKRQRNKQLARETGAFNIATIIHEATHQLAFNCGFQRRFADNPLWATEGMALYFETPDPGSGDGWSEMGKVNPARLEHFRRRVSEGRRPDALHDLLTNDNLLRTPATALDGYAEAWALSYFLIRTKPHQYHAYLRTLNAKPPLVWDEPQQRLDDFLSAFGGDLARLDREFVEYMTRRNLR